MGNCKDLQCNPKCMYFPIYSYEKTNNNYTTDEYGVKHSCVKAVCSFDGHIIKNWEECKNYKYDKSIAKDKLVVLMGKSAAGKDYIINFLKSKFNFNPIVSHTTRPIRKKETEGLDYYFITSSKFNQMRNNGEFIEFREYHTSFNDIKDVWYYGTSKKEFDTKVKKICAIDTEGLEKLTEYYGKKNIISIFIEVEDSIREERAKKRGSFSQCEWNRRLKDDNIKFKNNLKVDYIVENNSSKKEFENLIEQILRKEALI